MLPLMRCAGRESHMIDHMGFVVSDLARSRLFYTQALAPLGYKLLVDMSAAEVGVDGVGFGEPPKPDFWIIGGGMITSPRVHLAFRAATRAAVDAFYKVAIAAGGRDNGPPGLRQHYHPNYYGAFVLDPDGHNIEAVCHDPQ
jgi:catechol 2,3-dioxygenase-like lactoylglutathione lyase family enzyme